MFDDQNNNAGTPPDNLPSEPVDMFTGVDNTLAPGETNTGDGGESSPPNALEAGLLKKKISAETKENAREEAIETKAPIETMPAQEVYKMKEPILGKIIITLVVLVVLAGLGYAGWWGYNNYVLKKEPINPKQNGLGYDDSQKPVVNNQPIVTSTESNNPANNDNIVTDINNEKILFGDPIDTDKDGLDDVREKELGTDPNKADTDGDTLNDSDEVIIWKTDPLNSDTDGDTFQDGHEIRNGYSPTGPGKLNLVVEDTSTTSVDK